MNKYLLTGLLILISSSLIADSWNNPKTERYFSKDSTFMVKVIPTYIPEKYSKWVTAKPKKKKTFSEKDTTIIPCHAILYKIEKKDTVEVWNKQLINRVMPAFAIVADDGRSIVTFDNWGSIGYGLEAMVTYDEKGGLIRRYQLEEFSPFPINDYFISISSLWWRCGAKYLDNQTIEICFQNKKKEVQTRQYNVTTREFKKNAL
jgi:hypothetical protein